MTLPYNKEPIMTTAPNTSLRAGFLTASLFLGGLSLAFPGTVCADGTTNHAPWHHPKPVGVPFTVYGVNNVPDLHGDPLHANLVLFVAGNQFMVMPELISAFKKRYPDVRHIFYETLPPGILARQIKEGALTIGNLHLRIAPDIYESGKVRMKEMIRARIVRRGSVTPYAKNKLGLMVSAGNPHHIHSLADLGDPTLRLSLPNPKWEGIGKQIRSSLRKAGGEDLVRQIFITKRKNGTTYLTHIHHRETAVRILDGSSDAGITWISEVLFQESLKRPITLVRIPDNQNTEATYEAALLSRPPHEKAGKEWLAFLSTKTAQKIYRRYGFSPVTR